MSTNNALVQTDSDYEPDLPQPTPSAIAVWQDAKSAAVTSLDVQTDAGAETYLRCLRNADLRAKQCTADPIMVRDWFLHTVKPIVNNDGMEGGSLRLVFVLADGRTVATRSPAVLDCWRHVVQLAKMRKWVWPLAVKLRSVSVGEGREYLEIEHVQQATTAARKSR